MKDVSKKTQRVAPVSIKSAIVGDQIHKCPECDHFCHAKLHQGKQDNNKKDKDNQSKKDKGI